MDDLEPTGSKVYKARKQRNFYFLTLVLFGLGCAPHPVQIQSVYKLAGTSEYPFLVPPISLATVDGDFQTSRIEFPGVKPPVVTSPQGDCTISGYVFSLRPDNSSNSNQWIVRSLSVQGWQQRGGEIDLHSEWGIFLRSLLQLEAHGCFPPQENLYRITRAIVEKLPIQASEALLYAYALGGEGFVDLAPGMQLRVEKTSMQESHRERTASSYVQYEIVPAGEAGVALHLSTVSNHESTSSMRSGSSLLYSLDNRMAMKPRLRLFLQSSNKNGSKQNAILLGAEGDQDLDNLTGIIVASSPAVCPATLKATIDCISFEEGTAVSLLSSVFINGKISYRSIGTPVSSVIELLPQREQSRAIQTATLIRPLVQGGYAKVEIPNNLDGARQILLLSGDRLSWKR